MSPNVDSLANRLRMVQLECADVADDVRQQALTSELREAIKAVVPDQRKQFLAQLQSRFPSWAGRVDAVAATQSSFDENLLNNPDYLVGRLKELAAGLPTPRKEAIARELGEVGLSMTGKMSWPQEQMLEFRRVLGMEASESVDPCRLLEVCILLMNFACDADRVAWGTWRELAGPTSPIKRQGGCRRRQHAAHGGRAGDYPAQPSVRLADQRHPRRAAGCGRACPQGIPGERGKNPRPRRWRRNVQRQREGLLGDLHEIIRGEPGRRANHGRRQEDDRRPGSTGHGEQWHLIDSF